MIKVLDISDEQCPMTFVKTKVALSEIGEGDILEVLLRGVETLKNVPRSVKENGHKVLSLENISGDLYKMVVEK